MHPDFLIDIAHLCWRGSLLWRDASPLWTVITNTTSYKSTSSPDSILSSDFPAKTATALKAQALGIHFRRILLSSFARIKQVMNWGIYHQFAYFSTIHQCTSNRYLIPNTKTCLGLDPSPSGIFESSLSRSLNPEVIDEVMDPRGKAASAIMTKRSFPKQTIKRNGI